MIGLSLGMSIGSTYLVEVDADIPLPDLVFVNNAGIPRITGVSGTEIELIFDPPSRVAGSHTVPLAAIESGPYPIGSLAWEAGVYHEDDQVLATRPVWINSASNGPISFSLATTGNGDVAMIDQATLAYQAADPDGGSTVILTETATDLAGSSTVQSSNLEVEPNLTITQSGVGFIVSNTPTGAVETVFAGSPQDATGEIYNLGEGISVAHSDLESGPVVITPPIARYDEQLGTVSLTDGIAVGDYSHGPIVISPMVLTGSGSFLDRIYAVVPEDEGSTLQLAVSYANSAGSRLSTVGSISIPSKNAVFEETADSPASTLLSDVGPFISVKGEGFAGDIIASGNGLVTTSAGDTRETLLFDQLVSNNQFMEFGMAGIPIPAGRAVGLTLRWKDIDNYVRVFVDVNEIRIFQLIDGNWSTSEGVAYSVTDVIRAEAIGDEISVYLNGSQTPILSITQTGNPTGGVGFYLRGSDVFVDGFKGGAL